MPKPLHNRVVVRPDQKKNETEWGIVLPDSAVDDRPCTGTVLVGNDTVNEGDHVLFSKYGHDEFEADRETLYVVSDYALLAIL